ncbi:4-hydroxy-tetrahydrodipicolinate reductase [soil metagenome]
MQSTVRLLLVGGAGRMGQAIAKVAEADEHVQIVAQCGRGDELGDIAMEADVIIEVSHADAAERTCAAAVQHGKPLVIGTTGHSKAQVQLIQETARSVAVLLAPNFSVGVNTLFWLTRQAAEFLGDGFDVEIVETHHRLKKDAPSGTAKRLAEILCDVRELSYESDVAHGRAGMVGERPARQIGMHAVRAGDVVGEHTVTFAGAGERLELTHKASSRDTFAAGALRAARWIIGQQPGLYSMQDVLGLQRGAD